MGEKMKFNYKTGLIRALGVFALFFVLPIVTNVDYYSLSSVYEWWVFVFVVSFIIFGLEFDN